MRKLFSLFLALVTTTLWAYDFKSGDLYYKITSSSAPYTVEVTYQQSGSSSNYSGLTTATIPETVTYNGTTYSVTSIGDRAFLYCSSLTSVTIPNSVTYIGEAAFNSCSSLTSITIPNSVTSIGERAFTGCSSLTSPVYNAHYFAYMPTSFKGAYVIPEGIKQIAGGAFYNCSSLTSITIPNSVTSIGDKAFSSCESLTSITIPNSVTSIGREAFYDCSSLTSVTIPNSVTSIGYYAFRGTGIYNDNSNWENDVLYIDNCLIDAKEQISGTYTIKKNTRLIAAYAFQYCSSLTSITIPNSVTSIGEEAFGGCKSLTSITIPNSVKSIGENAFEFCSSLTSVTIPNSVTSIGGWAFYYTGIYNDNSNWENDVLYIDNCLIDAKEQISGTYTIKENTRLIADYAFRNCSYRTSITIPNSVKSIGEQAFSNCTSLTSIICEAETPPTVGYDAFDGVSKWIPVYVPCGCVKAYKAKSGWKEFTNIQEPQVEYAIQVSTSSSQMGSAIVVYNTSCGAQISATANIGYHFVQWSDGNTDNPRTLTLTKNTVLTAEFAPNKYTITTVSSDTQRGTTKGDTTVNYLEYITISATANYGYHFSHWNDGNTQNPRTVKVTEDKTYTAYFEKSTYTITKHYNTQHGSISGSTSGKYLDVISLTAIPNTGYHFSQWHDGVTDNPRSFVLTQDTTFAAFFDVNHYQLNISTNNPDAGTVSGAGTYEYGTYTEISATANYGYHFSHWNDGNTDNPRTVKVTEDRTYTAYFDNNTYSIYIDYDRAYGVVTYPTSGKYKDEINLKATPNLGYTFVGWSDGIKDNPRTIVLEEDIYLSANFTQAYSGQCGDDAYWKYDPTSQTISIMGFGEMYHYTPNTQPWILFKEKIRKVEIANDVTSLGTSAFAGCRSLGEVHIGHNLIDIYTNAFADCKRLYHVYCYPTYPPFADISSFANYTADLHIQCESKEDYVRDEVWGKFSIKCLGAETEELPSGEVTTTTTNSSVTITWPTDESADTYTIEIKRGDQVFCTLTFSKEGQLMNIAFISGRDGQNRAQYAEATTQGLRFTITSLDSGTQYSYDITTRDENNDVIDSYTGEFTTQSDVTNNIDNVPSTNPRVQKIIRDGQFIILRDGIEYNAIGQEL